MDNISKKMLKVILCIFLFAVMFFQDAAFADETPLKKISFVTLWLPQAQFAGYYAAKEKGIYEKYGLDVEIINGGPDTCVFTLIENGTADFGVLWLSAAMEMSSRGAPLVNICQFLQKSGLMLVAKKSRGILQLQDMDLKRVGLWPDQLEIQPKAFFKKYNLSVEIVPQGYTVNLFLLDGVDVASAMWYNEYYTIINSGHDPDELTTFFFYEHGLNFPEDGIYALKSTVDNDPEISRAFAAASIEGWIYAFENTEEVLDIVLRRMREAHLPTARRHQRWQIDRIKDLALSDGAYKGMGRLKRDDFKRVGNTLKTFGIIDDMPGFNSFTGNLCVHDED